MENYGFVYIWFDRKHKRYYIGCHWGCIDDGYVCSSSNMKSAYKRRPNDFKRKILIKIYTNKKDLLEEEYKWLSKIKKEELGKRYYNLHNYHFSHWSTDENSKLSVGEKISKSHLENPNFGKWNAGKFLSEETKEKISNKLKGKPSNYIRSKETRDKISNNNKRLQKENRIGMGGKKHSTETIEKMKLNNAMNNEENRKGVSDSKKGIRWLKLGDVRKMAIPNSDKYNELIKLGFKLI